MHDGVTLDMVARRTSGRLLGDGSVRITDVVHDSRDAAPGALFVAIPGFHRDGHTFLADAVGRGASAVCVQAAQDVDVPQVVVLDTRRILGAAAAEVHGDPSSELSVVGVTGTNGKTTVTYMLEAIAARTGRSVGVIGTLGARISDRRVTTARTTPEASDVQRLLREMVRSGVEIVAMEVSSHALALYRVDATRFSVAAFTNLTQDHLDFHGDMETYFQAKRRLFEYPNVESSVVWIDDPYGARLAADLEGRMLTVGRSASADVRPTKVSQQVDGSHYVLELPDAAVNVDLPVGGDFNVANSLVAAACAHLVGFASGEIAAGLGALGALPGRFERVDIDGPFSVIVDYAHTPDAIRIVVSSARSLTEGRVIVVIGAGGDRDRTKRPAMGAAAACADLVVVTSDNPRSESPEEIVAQVAEGVVEASRIPMTEPDRRKAIRVALSYARPGDIVLVLGKGHEREQDLGDRVVPFDDREVVREEAGVA
jgi:UDP-N-acetylmuramoyl-L-alanyl-D-glutamate--2,6-diaminopimelate ligase